MTEERSGPVVAKPEDIRKLAAKFPEKGAHWATIRGKDGYISAGGAKVAIFNRWVIKKGVGVTDDGSPRFNFKGQFSWHNAVMLAMVTKGTLRGRVILQMMTTKGRENVDILGWEEWRLEDGVLHLTGIYKTEGVKFRPIDGHQG